MGINNTLADNDNSVKPQWRYACKFTFFSITSQGSYYRSCNNLVLETC